MSTHFLENDRWVYIVALLIGKIVVGNVGNLTNVNAISQMLRSDSNSRQVGVWLFGLEIFVEV